MPFDGSLMQEFLCKTHETPSGNSFWGNLCESKNLELLSDE